MDCFMDFCLSCDGHTVDGPYCSEACRLADLEKGVSQPLSPLTPTWSEDALLARHRPDDDWLVRQFVTASVQSLLGTIGSAKSSRQSWSSVTDAATSGNRLAGHQYSRSQSLPTGPAAHHHLSPSSSRASLSSTTSGAGTAAWHQANATSSGMSLAVKDQLRSYVDSFDRTREERRKSLASIEASSKRSSADLTTGAWMTPSDSVLSRY